jgi:hypothetical protein
MSAAQVFNLEDFSTILYLPLSISAYGELVELQTLMEANPLLDQKDAWCYAWGDKYYIVSAARHSFGKPFFV